MKKIIVYAIPRISGCYGFRLVLKRADDENEMDRERRERVKQFLAPFDVWGGVGCTNYDGDFIVEFVNNGESILDNKAFICAMHNLGAEIHF